jgi:competence protein ComK
MYNSVSLLTDQRARILAPVFTGDNKSKIIRTDGIYYSEMTPRQLIEEACILNGSSKQGRRKAVSEVMNYYRRTPIIIVAYSVGAFPTKSASHPECIWIFNHHFHAEKLAKGKSQITFLDSMEYEINASIHTLLSQQQKLHSALNVFGNSDIQPS